MFGILWGGENGEDDGGHGESWRGRFYDGCGVVLWSWLRVLDAVMMWWELWDSLREIRGDVYVPGNDSGSHL